MTGRDKHNPDRRDNVVKLWDIEAEEEIRTVKGALMDERR